MNTFIILALCASVAFGGVIVKESKTVGSSAVVDVPAVSEVSNTYINGKTFVETIPAGGEIVYDGAASGIGKSFFQAAPNGGEIVYDSEASGASEEIIDGQVFKGGRVIVNGASSSLTGQTLSGGASEVVVEGGALSGNVVSGGVLPSGFVSDRTVIAGTPSIVESVNTGSERQVLTGGFVGTSATTNAGGPIITRYTSSGPAYVKNIYQDRSHVHPGKEIVYKVRTAPKVHKKVALVGRVVQQPKVNVVQIVKQPDIKKVTTIVKPAQKYTEVLPAKVSHVTKVYKAPEVEYTPKVWFAQRQRETSGNIVSVEKGKLGPQAIFDFNAPLPLSGEWSIFETPTWKLNAGANGVQLGAENIDLTSGFGAGALTFDSKTTNFNLGGKPDTTGSTTVHKSADGTTTTTTNFHSNSGVQGETVAAGSIGSQTSSFETGLDALNPFSFGAQQGLQGQTTVEKAADGSTITTTTYKSDKGLQGSASGSQIILGGTQKVQEGIHLSGSNFGQGDIQIKSLKSK